MPFEYAASFPREAESALKARKDSMKKCFSLLHDREAREKINEGVSLITSSCGDGYEWEISISQDVRQMMKNKAEFVMSLVGDELIRKFEAFVSLESDEIGHCIEWSPSFDSEGEEIIEMFDEQSVKSIATITEAAEFKKWIRYRRWL